MPKYDVQDETSGAHSMMRKVLRKHRPQLEPAAIRVCMVEGWRPHSTTGRLKLGEMKKLGDFDRELGAQAQGEIDFVLCLNADVWPSLSAKQKTALLHHELCHAAPMLDENGEQQRLDGKLRWRSCPHDIEEFTAVVETHGFYTKDLEVFGKAVLKHKDSPLFTEAPRDLSELHEEQEQ